MTRRRREPDVRELIRFIADNESLAVTSDEFPELAEERIRAMLRELAAGQNGQHPAESRRVAIEDPGRDAQLKLEIFTDGASRGNPGPAGAGWVIRGADADVLQQGNVFLGKRTNNEAEYEAVIHSLNAARALGATDVALRSDSELLVRQINGRYRVKDAKIARLHQSARDIIQHFRRFDVRHIPREQNAEADAQANRAIDDALESGAGDL